MVYVNSNGDSRRQIMEDYTSVINGLTEMIGCVSQAQSLYHGRNSTDPRHHSEIRNRHLKTINTLMELRKVYEDEYDIITQMK